MGHRPHVGGLPALRAVPVHPLHREVSFPGNRSAHLVAVRTGVQHPLGIYRTSLVRPRCVLRNRRLRGGYLLPPHLQGCLGAPAALPRRCRSVRRSHRLPGGEKAGNLLCPDQCHQSGLPLRRLRWDEFTGGGMGRRYRPDECGLPVFQIERLPSPAIFVQLSLPLPSSSGGSFTPRSAGPAGDP
jgi:hypothetical protein